MRSFSAALPIALCALLAACSGAQNGGADSALPQAQVATPASSTPEASASPAVADASVVAQTATPTPMPTIVLKSGAVNGVDNQFSPVDGDTSRGGVGQSVDGVACAPSMYENTYHVHFFLGLMVNGKQVAVPDGIGLYLPGAESNGVTNTATKCYYAIHTHDASGMIHVESSSTASLGSAIFTLGQVLDIWGEPLTASSFGPYSGTVRVFYATTPLRNLYSGTYYQYTGSVPKGIKISSHEAIWIQVGSTYVPASRLPKIRFYTEY